MANVLVAMSGGVDSSVAAALMVRAGHRVTGAYMKNWINEENVIGDCPWQQDIVDARAVADHLGIGFQVVNLMDSYRSRVVDYLLAGYRQGVTPNPDVMCNREIKFGAFLEFALAEGYDTVATGHYARRRQRPDGSFELLRGVDRNKDQSYFLALLQQHQVAAAEFPVGDLPKPEVRRLAHELGLPTAAKKDSQGICFIGNVKMRDFLAAFVEDSPGDIVDLEGRVLGRHRGLHFYTLGQRKGIGVPSNAYREAYVVVAKRGPENQLVVAFDRPDAPLLYAQRCRLESMSWVGQAPPPGPLGAMPRYRAPVVPARWQPDADGEDDVDEVTAGGTVVFEQPQRALTPGQVCALYDGEVLLGGGVFAAIDSRAGGAPPAAGQGGAVAVTAGGSAV